MVRNYFHGHQINAKYSDDARAAKKRLILSPLDTSNNVKQLSNEYDEEIARTIELGEPISIESILEGPALISNQMFEADLADSDVRR